MGRRGRVSADKMGRDERVNAFTGLFVFTESLTVSDKASKQAEEE